MESMSQWWQGVMDIPGAAWIIYPSLLLIFILIALYVLQALRDMALGGVPNSDDHLGSFRKMRDQGMLDSEEYKKLAGLVPMPELENKESTADVGISSEDALAQAAKDAIRKAAKKRETGETTDAESDNPSLSAVEFHEEVDDTDSSDGDNQPSES